MILLCIAQPFISDIAEALAKPRAWEGRGSVLAARDLPPHGQRGRCPSRVLQVSLQYVKCEVEADRESA